MGQGSALFPFAATGWFYNPIEEGWQDGRLLSTTDLVNIEKDQRTWGGDVNGGGHRLWNVAIDLGPGGPVLSVFGRTGTVLGAPGDYTADMVTYAVDTRGSYVDPPWLTLTWDGISGAPAAFPVDIYAQGALVAARAALNFIQGSNMEVTVADNAGASRVDITIANAGTHYMLTPAATGVTTTVATRPAINVVEGSNVSINMSDNPAANRVEVTFNSTGGGSGGGGVTPTYLVNGGLIGQQNALNLIAGANTSISGVNNVSANQIDITIAATGGGQTPWLSDIYGAGYGLSNVRFIALGLATLQPAPTVGFQMIGNQGLTTAYFAELSANGAVGFTLNNNNSQAQVYFNGNGSSFAATAQNLLYLNNIAGDIAFQANGIERARITFAGLMGIGTQTPQCAFDCAGRMRAQGWAPAPGSGAGIEVGFDGTYGRISSYDCSAPGWKPLVLNNVLYCLGDTALVGINTSTPAYPLTVNPATTRGTIAQFGNANRVGSFDTGAYFMNCELESNGTWTAKATTACIVQLDSVLGFYANDSLTAGSPFTPTQRMAILTNGHVGIGTSTPAYALDVNGSIQIATGQNLIFNIAADSGVIFWSGGTQITRRSSDGSLLINGAQGAILVTSASTTTINNDLHVGLNSVSGSQGDLGISRNTAPSTACIYWGSTGGAYIYFDGGSFNYSHAINGQAINAQSQVHIFNGAQQYALQIDSTASDPGIAIINNSAGGRNWQILSSGAGSGLGPGTLTFYDASAPAPRMTISPQGFVGIGVQNAVVPFQVVGGRAYFAANQEPYCIRLDYYWGGAGFYLGINSNATFVLSNNGAAAVFSCDQSGDVSVAANVDAGGSIRARTTGYYFPDGTLQSTAAAGGGIQSIACEGNSGLNGTATLSPGGGFNFYNGSVSQGGAPGGGAGVTVSYGVSDARLKQNVELLTGGLGVILQLRPIHAEWNGLLGHPKGQPLASVLAQELQPICPEAVFAAPMPLEPDGEPVDLMGVDALALIAHLILAVQQLEAKIEKLEGTKNHGTNLRSKRRADE